MRRLLTSAAAFLLVPVGAWADSAIDYDTAHLDRRLPATRATTPIVVDGRLDELAWQEAPVARDFIQNDPREGQPATEQTEVRVLYDDRTLYVGVLAHDREPDRLIVSDLKKDFTGSDGDSFGIVLDTFHDRRNGYLFETNPAGAKWDAQTVNEGREVNSNWDGVWTVHARVVEDGWHAEIAIPFRTLKFAGDDPQTWGINFLRRIRRRNEDSYWSPIPRIYEIHRVSLAGTLEELRGLQPGANLRVKPYALASLGDSSTSLPKGDSDVGFDAKYGLTTGLTWDFTVNTDFSQVEADEQQINLTRFSLFFPEKRDFFLENSGIFQFGQGNERASGSSGGGGSSGGAGGSIGGGRPQSQQSDLILFFSRQIGLSESGGAIPILAGTRLTGRVGSYTIGALNIQQRRQGESPSVNFTALRVRRDILRNSDVGLMILNKDGRGGAYNRVAGADANFRFFRNLNVNAFAAKTFSPILAVGGRGRDAAVRAGFAWRDNRWDVRSSYLSIGERFNDELGFAPRTGIAKSEVVLGAYLRPRALSGWLRELHPHWQLNNFERHRGGLQSRYFDYHFPLTLQNGTFIEIGANPTVENLTEPFLINARRNISVPAGRYEFTEWFLLYYTNRSAPLSFNGRYSLGDFYDGYKHTYQFGVTTRLSERFNGSLNLSRNEVGLSGGTFGTNLLSSRINYSFSTRMFLNALLQYNTDAQQWTSNIRFNLIHRPLSDFFLVYNERRDSRSSDILDRAVVAKMTYMVQF
ncbi:MAG: carbohydrate binding family 9 domain-containing protein [Acidobacteria bacterium]|nr:carbohydrate binding family 9 domain-containing protein [Acidobacteriota bacterium]